MPIYEYICEPVGISKRHYKISDKPLTVCSACNQPRLKKIISAAGLGSVEAVGMKPI